MVATENTSGIAASFKLDGIAPISRENSREWITKAKHLQGNQTRVGWISRKQSRSDRGGSFFLTSLFIELIDCRGSVSSHQLGPRVRPEVPRIRTLPHLPTKARVLRRIRYGYPPSVTQMGVPPYRLLLASDLSCFQLQVRPGSML